MLGGGEGDGARDLLILRLYRDRIAGHGEGVGVIGGGGRNRHRSAGRIRAVGLRVAGNHLVAGGGGDGDRHLLAGNKLGTGG